MGISNNYNKNVFLNCPFDDEYKILFNAIIFTVSDCSYLPRCALEIQDSSQNRLEKIIKIINDCQFAIHDLSRTTPDKHNNLPRFNMPFELGLFIGAKHYGNKYHKTKNCLILDSEAYRFQKFISDIAGHDIGTHENDVKKIIYLVRNWLSHFYQKIKIPSADYIYDRYKDFQNDIPALCKKSKFSINNLLFREYHYLVSGWLVENPI